MSQGLHKYPFCVVGIQIADKTENRLWPWKPVDERRA